MLIDAERRRAAGLLAEAERSARAIDSLTERTPGLDIDDAVPRRGVGAMFIARSSSTAKAQ
jgi:hypothetical protein